MRGSHSVAPCSVLVCITFSSDKEGTHLSAAIVVFQGQRRCYYVFQLSNFSLVRPLRFPPESSASGAVMATVWMPEIPARRAGRQ